MAIKGTVRFFNVDKGFGFIRPDDGGKDVFVHISAVERSGLRSLQEGQRVEFDLQPDKRGRKAINISLVTTEAQAEIKQAARPFKINKFI